MPGTRDVEFPKSWFEEAFGVQEGRYREMRSDFEAAAGLLICKPTGKMFQAGALRTPTLAELRSQLNTARQEGNGEYYNSGTLKFSNVTSDSLSLHQDPRNAGSVFQVCSLFNCLETVDGYHPEDGITHYCSQATQGSASAIACPAATFFRNYFVHTTGQGAGGRPVDLLEELSNVVQNDKNGYWTVKHGHCLPRVDGSIARLNQRLASDPELEARAREAVQVGVHWETEVSQVAHQVCQVFCGALPVGYLKAVKANEWSTFAKVVLQAAFEATLTVASCLAARRGTRIKVFLTALGAGSLSNRVTWIAGALERALEGFCSEPLDVALVHFAGALPDFDRLEAGRRSTPRLRPVTPTPSLGLSQMRDLDEQPEEDLVAVMRTAFACHDLNGDGVLDRSEFFSMLHKVDDSFFTPHVVDILLKEADADQDGKIYYHEFVRWICQEDEEIVKRVLH
ncbi:unnamed protein product [Effrenium voratum]|uniref:EF-hand domain-containing protein n=1 Tax=Effrenium voratum TaxID=2562239 RepID=A0AA36ILK7_9DINO|nr:unnamed protein product [Effrenium voratum]CAJ1388973.1 unnamed protein product [Effrenium voratum]CAJ1456984.1 unnamed protein product [Effrenium voratum]